MGSIDPVRMSPAFYLYVICFVSIGSSEDLAGGPEENILHKNNSLQRVGQEVEASGIGERNKENMYEREAETEGTKTDPLVEVNGTGTRTGNRNRARNK